MALNFGGSMFQGGEALANYDYTDIAAGTGIEEFYAGISSGANMLSNVKFYSDKVFTLALGSGAATFVQAVSGAFNVTMNLPRIIGGLSVVNIPFGMWTTSTAHTFSFYTVAEVVRVSDGAATSLVSGAGRIQALPFTAADNKHGMNAIVLDIPRTKFKKGDVLRLNAQLWEAKTAGTASTYYVWMGHDPMNRASTDEELAQAANRTFGTDPSILTFQVPFKLDI